MRLSLALALAFALAACSRARGTAETGEPCRSDFDCAHGYCAAASGAEPLCTITCARASECPAGWSCSGVTERGVVVCSPGSATPFGF